MPQRPKNFKIESVTVRPLDERLVPTGPSKAAPAAFLADVRLSDPELLVEVGVQVQPGGRPVLHHVTVWATPAMPLTSGSLHKVLLDPIVRAVLDEAQQTIEERPDVAPGAFHVPGDPEGQLWVTTPAGATERVRQIARLYLDAMTAGSKSPGLDAANAVHISRAQAARYIKRARDLGLLPPLQELLKAPAPDPRNSRVDPVADPTAKPDPGPSIFRDPKTPWPGQRES